VLAGAATLAAPSVRAQAWAPSRTVRIVAPFPPGGTTDLVARLIGQYLQEALGQPVIVENRSGAAGAIGMAEIIRSAPDGHTIGVLGSAHAAAPSLVPQLGYDAIGGHQPLGLVSKIGLVLVVPAASRHTSFAGFLSAARAEPGRVHLASAGSGNANHFVIELLKDAARAELVHVPYRGGGPAMNDVVGGQVDGMFNPVSSVLPLVRGGRLRALAITSAARSRHLPDAPTLIESGLPNFELYEWYGLTAPAGLPAPVAARYESELATILRRADVAERLGGAGIDVTYQNAADFRRFFDEEVRAIGALVAAKGIRAE
jgi:tripartite-type tricarboxylate transporter receptor subunit TctC